MTRNSRKRVWLREPVGGANRRLSRSELTLPVARMKGDEQSAPGDRNNFSKETDPARYRKEYPCSLRGAKDAQ